VITHDFVEASLESIDRLQAQLLVFPFFADERPLRGAAGLADWRLGGSLSRKLAAGYLEGAFGEKGMVAAPEKLHAEGVLLFGLGASEAFDERRAVEANVLVARAMDDARATTVALALPGRSLDKVPALRAMELWLAAESSDGRVEEVTVIEALEAHRELASLVAGLRRQALSPLD
jgi:hypothetical protein